MREPAPSKGAPPWRVARRAALLQALVALLLPLLAASQPAAPQQQPQALSGDQQAAVAAQCPFSVRYEVSLSQGQSASPNVPIFVASMALQNNENVSWVDCAAIGRAPLPAWPLVPARLPPGCGASDAVCSCPWLQYTIEDWRLGWRFPYGSVIRSQQVGGGLQAGRVGCAAANPAAQQSA